MQSNVTSSAIQQAVALLNQGELVAFPTETVYGLGGLATSPKAIQKIFKVKGRSHQKPLSLLIPNQSYLMHWVQTIPLKAERLADAFWPGPLTILLEPQENVLLGITAGSGRVGLRVPSHPVAVTLLSQLNRALAAPSANISGDLSPTTAESVEQQLGDQVSLILKDDSCHIGIESTVIDMTVTPFVIRRLGMISSGAIEKVLGEVVVVNASATTSVDQTELLMQWVEYPFDNIFFSLHSNKAAVLAHSIPESALSPEMTYIAMPKEPSFYQQCVYQKLFQLKQDGYRRIFIERLPSASPWESVTACLNRWCKSAILD